MSASGNEGRLRAFWPVQDSQPGFVPSPSGNGQPPLLGRSPGEKITQITPDDQIDGQISGDWVVPPSLPPAQPPAFPPSEPPSLPPSEPPAPFTAPKKPTSIREPVFPETSEPPTAPSGDSGGVGGSGGYTITAELMKLLPLGPGAGLYLFFFGLLGLLVFLLVRRYS